MIQYATSVVFQNISESYWKYNVMWTKLKTQQARVFSSMCRSATFGMQVCMHVVVVSRCARWSWDATRRCSATNYCTLTRRVSVTCATCSSPAERMNCVFTSQLTIATSPDFTRRCCHFAATFFSPSINVSVNVNRGFIIGRVCK